MVTLVASATEINILVVDDTPHNLRLLANILEAQSYTVLKSLNGRMALQTAHCKRPNLILLNINMPDMSGYEVCRQLKASDATADIPIIFISAFDQIDDKVYAFELGGQDYITKPFHELEVLARVKNQLLIQQQKQQLRQEIQYRQRAETRIRQLNASLERRIETRTIELQQVLRFELALKKIAEQVRDSLDQHQILQTAVETLGRALDVSCYSATLYDSDHPSATIRYQWVQPDSKAAQDPMCCRGDFPNVLEPLQQRTCVTFCQTQPSDLHPHAVILACSIFDDRVNQTGILGDLWLLRETHTSFSDKEIHLVQQAAAQCAIALRQARLYESAQAQVKELQRLHQLKDDFLSTVSHELRTPITNMKLVISLLNAFADQKNGLLQERLSSHTQDSKIRHYLKVLQEECDRELALVDDLLNLQQAEAAAYTGQIISINLQDVLPHLVEPFVIRAQSQQQTLDIHLAPDLPTLHLDWHRLERSITELLTNACKYTPVNGTIAIAAAIDPPDTLPMRCLHLSVTNTGIEIAPEERSRIFDKFYRIPHHDPWKYGGTGLGLALVQRLIEQMDGSIEVESANNQTCFRIRLPIPSDMSETDMNETIRPGSNNSPVIPVSADLG